MAQASIHFPRGFLWGTATASHQVEGNNTNNNWWAWEQRPNRIIHGDKSGLACDWWGGRWREDFDRASAANQNAHRMSIEWSRVQPAPDRWDENAIDRYRLMVRNLIERGMLPMVTLHHFSAPLWFEDMGGWENPRSTELFSAYVEKVVEALQEYVRYWITVNEPNVLAASGYLFGDYPPGKTSLSDTLAVMVSLGRAHAAAYHVIHRLQPAARVSIALNVRPFRPAASWSPLDRSLAGLLNSAFNHFYPRLLTSGHIRLSAWRKSIPEAKNTLDFLGIDYYTPEWVAFTPQPDQAFARRTFPEGADLSETNSMINDPSGIAQAIHWALGYKLPVIITENGIEDNKDSLRPRYMLQNLHQVWRAVNENYPVKGYFHWTLVDNFEWERGWSQRFGLWELDIETQTRRKRPSADLYAEICRENGITSEMVETYAPEILGTMFPD